MPILINLRNEQIDLYNTQLFDFVDSRGTTLASMLWRGVNGEKNIFQPVIIARKDNILISYDGEGIVKNSEIQLLCPTVGNKSVNMNGSETYFVPKMKDKSTPDKRLGLCENNASIRLNNINIFDSESETGVACDMRAAYNITGAGASVIIQAAIDII